MRAFKSPSLPGPLRAALSLGLLSIALWSSFPSVTSARPRPVEDMGDPDPTEGTSPTPQGASKAGRLAPTSRLGSYGPSRGPAASWHELRDLILRLSRVYWR
jgi:hypothetical protein